jgi:hypothetical protein
MKRRQISSGGSDSAKWGAVLVGLLILGPLVFGYFTSTHAFSLKELILFNVFWWAGVFIVHSLWDLKEVSIDRQHLYVTNGKREIQIPFSEVLEVNEEPTRAGIMYIRLKLRRRSAFGKKIRFIAEGGTAQSEKTLFVTEKKNQPYYGERQIAEDLRRKCGVYG